MIDKSIRVPLIGLPARMDPGGSIQYLSRDYTDAVLAAGGLPVVVPLVDSPDSLLPLAEDLDGIILTGSGSDVDPKRYSAVREPSCGPVQPLRDKTDFMLLDVASRRRIPVLAICFGLQSLNVFMGGTLIQDIPAHLKSSIRHNNPRSDGKPTHLVEITAGSLLEDLAGAFNIRVNSTHHQAVSVVGRDLEVIARAPDGVVEAVVATDPDRWILGVQWHPEKCYIYDGFSRRIFERFMSSCRSSQNTDERTDKEDTQGTRRKSQP